MKVAPPPPTPADGPAPGPIAIVGGRGYLGTHLAAHLRAAHLPFWIVGRQLGAGPTPPGFDYRSAAPSLAGAVAGAHTVIHLATLTTPSLGEKNPHLEVENLRFATELIAACRAAGVRHIVFGSSGGTGYGETAARPAIETDPRRPSCAHAVTQLAVERHLRLAAEAGAFAATVLRLANVYGGTQTVKGEQGVVSYLLAELAAGREISLWGDTVRDYLHVHDAGVAFHRAVLYPCAGFQAFNISSGTGTSLTHLVAQLATLMQRTPAIRQLARRPFDLACNVLANDAARAHLRWAPAISLPEGLRRALAEFPPDRPESARRSIYRAQARTF